MLIFCSTEDLLNQHSFKVDNQDLFGDTALTKMGQPKNVTANAEKSVSMHSANSAFPVGGVNKLQLFILLRFGSFSIFNANKKELKLLIACNLLSQ